MSKGECKQIWWLTQNVHTVSTFWLLLIYRCYTRRTYKYIVLSVFMAQFYLCGHPQSDLCGFFGLFGGFNVWNHINNQLSMLYVLPLNLRLRANFHLVQCQKSCWFGKYLWRTFIRFVDFFFSCFWVWLIVRFCFRDFLHCPFIYRHWFDPFQVMDDRWESEIIEFGAINITGFRIVDTNRRFVRDFFDSWKRLDPATSIGAGRESISVRNIIQTST